MSTTRICVMCTVVFAVFLLSFATGTWAATKSCPADHFLLESHCLPCPSNSTRAENSTLKECTCLVGSFTVHDEEAECLPRLPVGPHWYSFITLKKVLVVTGVICALFLFFVSVKYYRFIKKKNISRSAKYSRLGAERGAVEELEDEDIEMSIFEKK